MADGRIDRAVGVVSQLVVTRPAVVVLGFLVVTAIFGAGLGSVSTSSGTQQFTEDAPAANAFEDVQQKFNPPFQADSGSTQLIQSSANVLSKPALLRMLTTLDALEGRSDLRVSGTNAVASQVARQLDPTATTPAEQKDAVEEATPSEIDRAVRRAADQPGFAASLSDDFNRRSATASATIAVVRHDVPRGLSASAGTGGGTSPLQGIQLRVEGVASRTAPDVRVFGSGIVSAEFQNVIFDSLIIVVPAASLLILAFLVFAYRDLIDLLLGVVSLIMAIVWTLGFMGLVGIPFSQMLVAVPPLLLAVGIDFGIHSINRYREERHKHRPIEASMLTAADQLVIAFFIVTMTTVIGFLANTVSELPPIRDFGVVAAIGILFVFLIFGLFLPAAKVFIDQQRHRLGSDDFAKAPLGGEESSLGSVLAVGVLISRKAPYVFLVLVVLSTVGMAYYGAGVSTSFQQEDFLPPKDTPSYLQQLPEPFRPNEYTVTRDIDFLDRKFTASAQDSVTMYVEGPMRQDYALEAIHRAGRDPPPSFVTDDRRARETSIVTVIQREAAADPQFARVVARNDLDGNGVPDENLDEVYAALLRTPARDRALQYVTDDYRSARVVYDVKSDASADEVVTDAREVASRYRYSTTATGQTVVFQEISDLIFESALTSLVLALSATAVFLVGIFWILERQPLLGLVNVVPIIVTVAAIAASMRVLAIPFNALTATILSITIGLGVDYSSHIVHRFADEYTGDNLYGALDETVRGTGGALLGSMLTTTTGIGVLVLAITPILGQFGLLTALSILYSFLSSLIVVPSALVPWQALRGGAATGADGRDRLAGGDTTPVPPRNPDSRDP